MKILNHAICSALLLVLWASAPAAAERETEFRLEGSTGIEYDSNVAVLELDQSSGEGDTAALIDVGAGVTTDLTERLDFKAGYDFSQSLYQDFDQFNLGIHRLSAESSYDFGPADAGLMYQFAHASLDGDEFLVLQQLSPYVSRLFEQTVFVRLAYIQTDKDFDTNPGRDADQHSGSADLFYFLDGARTYVAFGYRYDDENALDDQFDYAGHRLKAQISHRVNLASQPLKLKARFRFETRDYEAPTPLIGTERNDDRYRLELLAEAPLTEHMFIEAGYEYADNRSNLPSVDFDENILGVSFGARL